MVIAIINFLFHVLTIKHAIESVSGYWNTSSGQSGSDVTRFYYYLLLPVRHWRAYTEGTS